VSLRDILVVVLWLALVAFPLLVIVLKVAGVADGTNFYDFGAYYNAAERAIHGYPLYDWTTDYSGVTDLPDSPVRFLYAPITVLLFIPFLAFRPGTAAVLWAVMSASIYLFGIVALCRSFDTALSRRQWIMLITGAVGFGPFVITTIAGQVSAMLSGLLCLAAAHAHSEGGNRNAFLTGAFTAIPVLFKAFYAPVGAILLRDNRRLVSSILVGVSLLVAGILVFGLETTIDYLDVLRGGKGWGSGTDAPREWTMNKFRPFYFTGPFHILLRAGIIVTVACVAILSRKKDFESIDLYIFSLGCFGVVFGGPTVASAGLTILVPVILILLFTTIQREGGVFLAVLTGTFLVHIHPYTVDFLVVSQSPLEFSSN
jgi:hypothetical protein